MRRGATISAGILFVLLATLGLVLQQPNRALTRSTWGTTGFGQKAMFDFLLEAGVDVKRSTVAYGDLPDRATVWFIAPEGLCDPMPEAGEDAPPWSGRGWLERGGTAVVFLTPRDAPDICPSIAGVTVPPRPGFRVVPPPAEDEQNAPPTPAPEEHGSAVEGALLPRPRTLPQDDAVGFSAADTPAKPILRLRPVENPAPTLQVGQAVEAPPAATAPTPGRPFAVEAHVGEGRVVLIGDAAFLSNEFLDKADSAPLLMDLVRAYGPPLIDERNHGFGASTGSATYLLHSPALAMFAGLLLLGLAFAWWGAALPPRTARNTAVPAPALDHYIDSLATLYGRTQDAKAAALQYRDLVLHQIRRRLGLAADTPAAALIARLTRAAQIDATEVQLLTGPLPVASELELRQLAQALDEVLRKATR